MNTNPFRGINPILHSLLQDTTKSPDLNMDSSSIWPSFHAQHIVHLTDAIQQVLPPGYAAFSEKGLQVNSADADDKSNPIPDVSAWRLRSDRPDNITQQAAPMSGGYVMTLENIEEEIESRPIRSVAIYYEVQSHRNLGRVVTRIELLSPSNKPGGSGYAAFLKNYVAALKSGTSLITLDYLHETPSPFSVIPAYPREPGSHPYYVTLADARTPKKETNAYGFDVDSPIPALTIPLNGSDQVLNFDFDGVYQHTYQVGAWPLLVERQEQITRWSRYSRADQDRIIQRTSSHV